MVRKTYLKSKMATSGIKRLDTNNPFTAETPSFVDLITESDLNEGLVHYLDEKKARAKKKPQGIKGYPPAQATLDLHGEIAVVAERRTISFVQTSIVEGLKTLRIITGKGLHSPGGKAVLPGVVETQLGLLKYDGVIFDFAWDKKVRAKSGAVLVYL